MYSFLFFKSCIAYIDLKKYYLFVLCHLPLENSIDKYIRLLCKQKF